MAKMGGLLPDFTVWGIIDYITFFTTFSVMFTIFNGMFMSIGDDIESRWGRTN